MSNTFSLPTHDDPRHPDALALAIVAAALRAVSADFARPRPRASQIAASAEGALAAASVVAEGAEVREFIFELRMAAARNEAIPPAIAARIALDALDVGEEEALIGVGEVGHTQSQSRDLK